MVYLYAYAIYRVLRTEGYLMVRASVGSVRRAVAEHVGSKVKVRSNLGRHKYDVTEGVITETYPCIFLVQDRKSVV